MCIRDRQFSEIVPIDFTLCFSIYSASPASEASQKIKVIMRLKSYSACHSCYSHNSWKKYQIMLLLVLSWQLCKMSKNNIKNVHSMNRFLFNSIFCFLLTIVLLVMGSPIMADQNDPRLDLLFKNLKASVSFHKASSVEIQIWKIWIAVSYTHLRAHET